MLIFQAHEGAVNSMAFSPDGETLATAGKDGLVRLWDGPMERATFAEHQGPVHCVAFSTEGHFLASGGADRTVQIWDIQQLEQQAVCGPYTLGIEGLGFWKNDQQVWIAIGDRLNAQPADNALIFWNVSTGTKQETGIRENESIRSLALYPPHHLAWVTQKSSHRMPILRYRDIRKQSSQFFGVKHECRSLAFSPDGNVLAIVQDWQIQLYDLNRQQLKQTLIGHKGVVTSVAFSPDGQHLMSASWDKSVRIWNMSTGKEVQTYTWPIGRVLAVAYAPDGLRAAASGDTGMICLWDIDS